MKTLIEKLALGNAAYETPDAEIEEKRITVALETDSIAQGSIHIKGKNNMAVKGVVFSTDSHITFENNQFNGINNTVTYTVTSKNMSEGQSCNGTVCIVTTAGDYELPFAISVRKKEIESTIGKIADLKGFVGLVQQSYDEALILFLSKDFQKYFLKGDIHGTNLYHQVMRNENRSIALEEFLVGMGLKERVKVSIIDDRREYIDIMDNYGDVLNISRSCWGYVDIDVEIQGSFLYNCKTKITGDDFNGKIAEYQYLINANKLHGGSNLGRIILKTSEETITYNIVITNQKKNISAYISEKNSRRNFVKNYLNFRTGVIDGRKWMDEMSILADERLAFDSNDAIGLLAKAQISILRNESEHAMSYLKMASQVVADKEEGDIEQYCYYLYLKTLFKNRPEYTDDIKAEIKHYFEGGHDTWQLLWMLFYMDERYDENPSLKYTLVKRMFNNGCHSPIMYYEAANVLNKQPELLRILNKFEIQILNFVGKYHLATEELAKQTAEIMSREKGFHENYLKILMRIYEDTKNEDVLYCICSMIIHGNKINTRYFHWLEEGVKKELKITNLYEYYIYTADTGNYDMLQKSVYKYFSYGTDTLIYNRDYFYANLITNFSQTDELFLKYRENLEKYVTQELLKGNNNAHLRIVYSRVLNDNFIVGNMEEKMPEILHTYQLKVDNENIKTVMVSHKEIQNVQTVPVIHKTAYVQLYTEHPVLIFMDNRGRYLSQVKYEKTYMDIDTDVTKVGKNVMTRLCETEKIMKNAQGNQSRLLELKETDEIPQLTSAYRNQLKEFIVDYYYQNYDHGELDIYILQFNMAQLSKVSRDKVMEILIERNLATMAYPYIVKYGYENIKNSLLEKMCIQLVEEEDFDYNERLTEICARVFRNGCRNINVLKFLGKYNETGSNEMYHLFLALKAKGVGDNTLAERLLVQYIFEGNTEDKIYDIYEEYLKGPTSTVIRKAFYTYVTYNYFMKQIQCPDIVWEILEQEYDNGLATPLICKITFVEVMSKRTSLTQRQIKISENILESLEKSGVNFEFYKKFDRWFKIPFGLVDKTIIDYRTNPKHRVDITYEIITQEGNTSRVTEEMRSIYPGIFTKEVIMFFGEKIDYSITEYSDDFPHGKVVERSSVRITEKNVYNDESRFGMINGMMICKDVGRDGAAREIMQSYELCKEAGKKIFKLL